MLLYGREDLWHYNRHPEASYSEAVRISSFLGFWFFINILKDEILTSSGKRYRTPQNDGVGDEIATSSNQRTVGLLAMTDLDRYFHPHLVPSKWHKSLSWKLRNKRKVIKQKTIKAHPPESPLNGGISQIIPLLGGVPFYGGEGAFNRSSWGFVLWSREDLIFYILILDKI